MWYDLLLAAALLTQVTSVSSSPTYRGQQISTLVNLGYAKYQGTALAAGVNQWLGIRFAAPPLGDLRFRAPQDPHCNETVQDAFEHGPLCYSVGAGLAAGQSEDCLFLDVYAPSNATRNSKLPVFLWIQGGGYAANSNANYNGTDLITSSGGNMVVVTFNYRVGPFGFLASEEVQEDGSLNNGILDQRKMMHWVQRYIIDFGGDPDHVVLVGASAGAGSIAMHLIAYGGRNDHLFVGAIGESVFFPTQPLVSELEFEFNDFANASGCAGAANKLACLRSQNSSTLQLANQAFPYPGHTVAPLFTYSPCIDGDLLRDYPYRLFEREEFVRVPVIFGNDNNEGSYFAVNAASPQNISTFFINNYPKLTAADTAAINNEYPLSQNPPVASHAEYFSAASNAYGESTFNCPGLLIDRVYANCVGSAWSYRYNVLDPANVAQGLGTPHVAEIPAVWGVGSAGGVGTAYQTTNAVDVPLTMDYWISFVRTLNPNTYREAGSPYWDTFGRNQQRLLFYTNNTHMETVPQAQRQRCAFWESLSIVMEQ